MHRSSARYALPLGDCRYRVAIRLADIATICFRETRFAHCSLRIGSQSLRNNGPKFLGQLFLAAISIE
jgi:hypothetical protein